VYETIRNITGLGVGNGPMITIHDGSVNIAWSDVYSPLTPARSRFVSQSNWYDFLPGADRLALGQSSCRQTM